MQEQLQHQLIEIKKVTIRNFAPFTDCISEINNTQVYNANYIDIVMPMYDLIEHNYFKPSGSLWQYCKDIPAASNSVDIVGFNGTNATASFNFKAKTTHLTRNN